VDKKTGYYLSEDPDHKFGTVGAVALDKTGNIVAGTSTGGMTNKRYNRIGDSPIIGAGTYANNATCGVSSTGHGEYFIRYAVAYDIHALMDYKGLSLDAAAEHVINEKLKEKGGSGGIISVDHLGNVSMPFNTAGMYRGYVKAGGERATLIYGAED
ncbi:MAG: isoaspartyl peptidase/L-asparaginase, partial [Bacteroidota bacterium]